MSCIFFATDINTLCSLNFPTGKIETMGIIPGESLTAERLAGKIVCNGSKLCLMPIRINDNSLWVYDLNNKSMDRIVIDAVLPTGLTEKFSYITIYKNKLFLVGCYYNGIVIDDFITGKQHILHDAYSQDNVLHTLFTSTCVGKNLYIPMAYENSVLVVDVETEEIELK